MTKSLLISIQPQHLLNILNGLKTYEVRKVVPKWVIEKLDNGKTVEAYLYCTKGKARLFKIDGRNDYHISNLPPFYGNTLNGTIPCKVVIDGYVKYVDCSNCSNSENGYECENDFRYLLSVDPILRKATCLTSDEIEDYGNGKDLYALHISKLEILDEVMKLGDFVSDKLIVTVCGDEPKCYSVTALYYARKDQVLKRPPQNMMSVWVK